MSRRSARGQGRWCMNPRCLRGPEIGIRSISSGLGIGPSAAGYADDGWVSAEQGHPVRHATDRRRVREILDDAAQVSAAHECRNGACERPQCASHAHRKQVGEMTGSVCPVRVSRPVRWSTEYTTTSSPSCAVASAHFPLGSQAMLHQEGEPISA